MELQGALWEPRGGLEKKGSGPGGFQGGAQNVKNMILGPLSFYPKRSGAYKYSGFSVFRKKTFFFQIRFCRFSGGAREGPKTCVGRPRNFQGGPRESGTGPRGPFLGGPGSAKVCQGSIFDGKTGLVLRFPFFALNDFWKAPRGSRERAAEQQEFQRGAQGGAPSSLWGPEGGPRGSGDPQPDPAKPEDSPSRPGAGAEGPGENKCQRLTQTNRSKNKN